MTNDHTAAKVATFGMITDRSETRWCPDCEIVATVPTIPPEGDTSVYDCDECGELMDKYHPSMNHDRCRACGDYIPKGKNHCETCADADECATDKCANKAPWGDYCHPQCGSQ